MNHQVNFEHELDVSWILALWFAIHGGDPGPEGGILDVSEETYRLAHGLVENLLTTYAPFGVRALSDTELEARLVKVGGILPNPEESGGGSGGEPQGGEPQGGPLGGPDIGPGGVVVSLPCVQTPRQGHIHCFTPISRAPGR